MSGLIFYIGVAVLFAALLTFCSWFFYRIGYNRGYKRGANAVLKQWRETLNTLKEME